MLWNWYSGSNNENFSNGPFANRAEAVASLEGEGGYVIEGRQDPLKLSEWLPIELDAAEEQLGEEDPVFDVTPEQEASLLATVKQAIDAWQTKNYLVFHSHTFTAVRSEERIPPNATD